MPRERMLISWAGAPSAVVGGIRRSSRPGWLGEGCDYLSVPAPDGVECLVVHSCDVLVSAARLRIPQGMHVTVHTHHPVSETQR